MLAVLKAMDSKVVKTIKDFDFNERATTGVWFNGYYNLLLMLYVDRSQKEHNYFLDVAHNELNHIELNITECEDNLVLEEIVFLL